MRKREDRARDFGIDQIANSAVQDLLPHVPLLTVPLLTVPLLTVPLPGDSGTSPIVSFSDSSTCPSLLRRIHQDDDTGWEQFVRLYTPLVTYWISQDPVLTGSDVPGVNQEVFLSVHNSIGEFERFKTGSLRSWLRAITNNHIADWKRRDRNQNGTAGMVPSVEVSSHETDSDSETEVSAERRVLFESAMRLLADHFEPTSRNAFLLMTLESASADEVSQRLGISKAAVWQACYRIRKKLREELEGLSEDLLDD